MHAVVLDLAHAVQLPQHKLDELGLAVLGDYGQSIDHDKGIEPLVEPHLELEWLALSGLSNTTILATREELERVEDAIEELLAPYVLRKDAPAGEVPDGARLVRIRRHVLPAAAEPDGAA